MATPYNWPQSRDIHIIIVIPATVSFLATAIAGYWFLALLIAEGNLRRTLVLILILADCSKSFWIMVFNITGLATSNHIPSSFCQIGGFLLQFSYEACDLAIVFLVTHVSLQILPACSLWPSSRDGLWKIRYCVYTCCIALPSIAASIPFIRKPAYNYDGVYCSLFTGPLWMNLTLSSVPRYVAWIYLLVTIIRLYFYIRSQSVGRSSDASNLTDKLSRVTTDTSRSTRSRPRKQFRAVSLYPIFYILAWSVPFSLQVVAYSTTRGINSAWPHRAAAVSCISSLGLIDVVVFCCMEKPWRYDLRLCWKRPERPNKPRTSGSDLQRRRALDAYERLALERSERPKARRSTPSQDISMRYTLDQVELPSDGEV